MDLPPKDNLSEFITKKESFLGTFGVKTYIAKVLLAGVLTLIALCAITSFLLMPPSRFPSGTTVIIQKGMSLGEASYLLKENNYIRSRVVFEFCALSMSGNRGVQAGGYLFKEPASSCALAMRLTRGVTGVPAVRLTIPEGSSNKEIAKIAAKNFTQIKEENFLVQAQLYEGNLFPETYFFLPTATEADVITMMRDEFEKNIVPLKEDIRISGHTLHDVVVMASILEKEARTEVDQKMISGILWKRISIKMALQVDAPFLYALGKTSAELTQTDLKRDSPYNTYTRRGLPVGPIGNPGMVAIRAALYPTESPYLYYLSDNDGGMHYAKTFEEHKVNKAKYLTR